MLLHYGWTGDVTLVLISLTKTMTKNDRWRAFVLGLRRAKDDTIIRSINDNYDYINMQFHRRNKTRLNCIQKIKSLPKTYLFLSKKLRQNVIADCCTRLYYTRFHVCGCQMSNPQIRVSLLHGYIFCHRADLLILINLATMRTRLLLIVEVLPPMIWKLTNKLEFSDLIESVTQCMFCHEILTIFVCDCDHWINALTQPLLFREIG